MITARTSLRGKHWFNFIIGGVINTGFTYSVYLFLSFIFSYQISYFIAYFMGVIFNYLFNSLMVFRVPLTLVGLCSYPLAQILLFICSASLITILVEYFDVDILTAPFLAMTIIVPFSYGINRAVLR
jgi:putative flippase GtrA